MARARNIKPGFFRNADLVELSFEARLLFIGLWTLADRDGRLEDRPKQIKMELFPADSVDCNALLDDLAATGMVARYTVDAKRYLQVVNFAKHQNPHRDEKASTIPDQHGNLPAPCKPDANTVQAPCKPDANTVPIGLNPESGFLNPESLNPEPTVLSPGGDHVPSIHVQAVVDVFHEALPELPRVKLLSDKRKKSISNFCKWVFTSKKTDGSRRAQTKDEALDWIRSYFDRARDNDWLMGRGSKAAGHENWQCDIDFLISEKGMKHVIERTKG